MGEWVLHEDQSQHLLPAGSEADSQKEGGGRQSTPRWATQAGPPETTPEGATDVTVDGMAPPAAMQRGGPGSEAAAGG